MAAPVVDALGNRHGVPSRDPCRLCRAAFRLAAGDPGVDQDHAGAGDAVQRWRDGRGPPAQAEQLVPVTALIALLGGVRATVFAGLMLAALGRSEEHTSELQSLMRTSSAVLCLTKQHKSNAAPPRHN